MRKKICVRQVVFSSEFSGTGVDSRHEELGEHAAAQAVHWAGTEVRT